MASVMLTSIILASSGFVPAAGGKLQEDFGMCLVWETEFQAQEGPVLGR